jgi:hypothetical protein
MISNATLKEKIEHRKNNKNELANDYATKQVSFYHSLCSDEFRAGYDSAMKEVLPILLECVEALETTHRQVTRGYPTYIEWEGIWIKNNQAIERLRKWSEG